MRQQFYPKVQNCCKSCRLLPPSCLKRGIFVSEQQICEDDRNRIVSMCQAPDVDKQGHCETQLWGVPWSEDEFIEQMVKFGHPMTVKSGLPEVLQSTIEFYTENNLQQRLQYRAESSALVALARVPVCPCARESGLCPGARVSVCPWIGLCPGARLSVY